MPHRRGLGIEGVVVGWVTAVCLGGVYALSVVVGMCALMINNHIDCALPGWCGGGHVRHGEMQNHVAQGWLADRWGRMRRRVPR